MYVDSPWCLTLLCVFSCILGTGTVPVHLLPYLHVILQVRTMSS
jgi:hypothetical protein